MKQLIPSALVAGLVVAAVAVASPATAQQASPFPNCAAAYAAGRSNIPQGDPTYGAHLDRDGDGIGCDDPPAGFVRSAPTTRKAVPSTTGKPAGAVKATPKFTG